MKATKHPFVLSIVLLSLAALVCMAPIPARAGGDDKDVPSTRPRPDRAKKVFTNDDFERPGSLPIAVPIAAPAGAEPQPAARTTRTRAQAGPYIPEKDPAWYAQQASSLEAELTRIDADAQFLQTFRATGSTQGTGVILNGPCEGITTDNRIAQLADRRREIEAQLDTLSDTARRNDLPPGIFSEAAEIVEASRSQSSASQLQVQASLRNQLTQAEEELAQTHGVVAGMEADTSARNMTLLRPVGLATNFTTDLLLRLDARSAALEGRISSIEDEAHRAGVQPGLLR